MQTWDSVIKLLNLGIMNETPENCFRYDFYIVMPKHYILNNYTSQQVKDYKYQTN